MKQALSIVMDATQTHRLKGLQKVVPFAVIEPHTLFVLDGNVHGLARYASNQHAEFEMPLLEFEQLSFEFVIQPLSIAG